jgi:thiamine-phosphate pyrophosphorylase
MADAGIRTIQLRAKSLDDASLFREAVEVVRGLEGWSGSLWIDDRVDLALLLEFAGVHLGRNDLPASAVRGILPADRRIGASTHDEFQFAAALAESAADWVAFGPVFATRSKANPDPVVGLEALSRVARRNRSGAPAGAKPLIAIGGIDERTVGEVLAAGADSAAVISAVCSGDVAANCRRLLAAAA